MIQAQLTSIKDWLDTCAKADKTTDDHPERLAYYLGVSLSNMNQWLLSNERNIPGEMTLRRLLWLKRSKTQLRIPFRLLRWVPGTHDSLDLTAPPGIKQVTLVPVRPCVVQYQIDFAAPVPFGLCLHTKQDCELGVIADDDALNVNETYTWRWFPGSENAPLSGVTLQMYDPAFHQ